MSLARAGLLVALIVVVASASCTSTSPTPAPVDTCALVPNMDELVGHAAVDRPGAFTLNGVERCIWTYATTPARSVGISVANILAHGSAIETLGDGEPVPDLGNDARWWPGNHMLSIALGERSLQVDLQLDAAESTRDLAVQIARAAIERLG